MEDRFKVVKDCPETIWILDTHRHCEVYPSHPSVRTITNEVVEKCNLGHDHRTFKPTTEKQFDDAMALAKLWSMQAARNPDFMVS